MSESVLLSIVIPFFRDNEAIVQGLASIERACGRLPEGAARPEVIVVDDHSPIPFAWHSRTLSVRCCRMDKNRGAGAARNRGAQLARGDYLLFMDSDVMLDECHLERLYGHLAEGRGPIVQGPTAICPANRPATAFHHYMAVSWNYYQTANWAVSVFTQCFAVDKTFFHALGGFSEDYERSGGEEFELGLRLARFKPGAVFFDPGLVHLHQSENLIKRLKKVYLRSRHIRPIALAMPNLPFRFTAQSLLRSCFALLLDLSMVMALIRPLSGIGLYALCAALFYTADDSFSRHIRRRHSLGLSLISVVFRQLEYTFINLGMIRALFGFEKRPMSALRVSPRHCGAPEVRLIPQASQALTSNVLRDRQS
ncbi:hypothetical protein JCM14469_38350 [Desulfatiferula olefinivorans]